jgi:general secretion pathway protein B
MSFILDALRKSEHERQMVSVQNTGILYQVDIRKNEHPFLIPALMIIAVLLVLVLIWLMLPHSNQNNLANSITRPEIIKGTQPQTNSQEKILPLAPVTIREKHNPEITQKKVHSTVQVQNPKLQPTFQEANPKYQEANTKRSNVEGVDPLSGLPPLTISGYIHNNQSGNLAMINNKLVHEGEEIYPGLLLIKILENSAILSYKGYVFTR